MLQRRYAITVSNSDVRAGLNQRAYGSRVVRAAVAETSFVDDAAADGETADAASICDQWAQAAEALCGASDFAQMYSLLRYIGQGPAWAMPGAISSIQASTSGAA